MENITRESLIEAIKVLDQKNGITTRWYGFLVDESILSLLSIIEGLTPNEGGPISEDDVFIFPGNYIFKKYMDLDYEGFSDWVSEQILMGDTHYYAKPKEDFFMWEAVKEAAALGKHYVIVENMS
jgi:hypothetical protein